LKCRRENSLSWVRHEIHTSESLLEKAVEFHGHLGPFLVIGVRMGQIGLKVLDAAKHRRSLVAYVRVPLHVPYSCIVDGIQISTKCTVGNQKLRLENSEEIEAKFLDSSSKRSVTIKLLPRVLAMTKEKIIGKNLPEEAICELALNVASMTEKDLFIVKNQ
jgi:formylmethanofuran dehydrogenase subunit E